MGDKQNKGFRVMDSEKHREIASKGGKAAHAAGRAHEFTRDEAVEAGRLGGLAVSRNREHMAEIGKIGGGNSRRGSAEEPVVDSEAELA